MAYLSKKLDPVSSEWPPCLRALAATILLIKEAEKLTLGQQLTVKIPHSVVSLMNGQGQKWVSNTNLTQYQGLLLEKPHITLQTVQVLNPATYLLTEEGEPEHNCLEIITEVYTPGPDLKDGPQMPTSPYTLMAAAS